MARSRAQATDVLEADGVQVLLASPCLQVGPQISLDLDFEAPLGPVTVRGVTS